MKILHKDINISLKQCSAQHMISQFTLLDEPPTLILVQLQAGNESIPNLTDFVFLVHSCKDQSAQGQILLPCRLQWTPDNLPDGIYHCIFHLKRAEWERSDNKLT
eukprot:scaffold368088_cov20-Prasinocladus_malaysianus.AAC.1